MKLIIKKIGLVISIGFCSLLALAQTEQSKYELIGHWQDEANPDKKIIMYKHTDGKIYGKTSTNVQIFRELVWNTQTQTFEGKLKAPQLSEETNITIRWVNEDKFQFKIKKFFITKTFNFSRIK